MLKIQEKFKVRKYQDKSLYQLLNKSWSNANPKPHECCFIEDFVIVKTNPNKPINSVSVSTTDNNSKNNLQDIPKRWQSIIKELKIDYKLNKSHVTNLKKQINKLESQTLSFNKKINRIEKSAKILLKKKTKRNIKRRFFDRCNRLFDSINEEIYELDPKERNQCLEELKRINSLIIETIHTLENS